jgi:DNA-binding response OmpR family regulator
MERGTGPVVLLVEDSDTLRQYAKQALETGGFNVAVAADGRQALTRYREDRPALVVLDVDLPYMDGWEILARIREVDPDTPVLMLTATAQDERSRVRGLVSGADDYVVKPVGPAELRARVTALLRRAGRHTGGATAKVNRPGDVYEDSLVRVDHGRRRASVAGRDLSLTPLEFKLLSTFVRNAGETLDRQALLEQVWDDYSGVGGDQVKVYIGYLRRKLSEATEVELIETVRGYGYRYAAPGGEPGS